MSRVGKKPIAIPAGVQVNVAQAVVTVKGPKGELTRDFTPLRVVIKKDKDLAVEKGKADSARWGLARSLLASMVEGTEKGFTKTLEVHGVGFRAAVSGQKLTLELGFSHPVEVLMPKGVEGKVQKNHIIFSAADAELLGDFVAKVRALKPPEPYKGKGLRYLGEHVRQKEGKKAATEGAGGAS